MHFGGGDGGPQQSASATQAGTPPTTAASTSPTTITSATQQETVTPGAHQSVTSGNYGNASTWQVYNGSHRVPASSSPSSASGVPITVLPNNTVTVTASVSVDQAYVNDGGTLVVSSSNSLTVVNTTSPGLEVDGSLVSSGTLTGGGSSSLYIGDVGDAPATTLPGVSGEILLAGSSAQTLSGIGTYGNLELNNTSSAGVSLTIPNANNNKDTITYYFSYGHGLIPCPGIRPMAGMWTLLSSLIPAHE